MKETTRERPRIVIVGAGFGGLSTAKSLGGAEAEVILIDRNNYHLFVPLLYQVATAGLSPSDIAVPIRRVFRKQSNTTVLMAQVTGLDLLKKEIVLDEGRMAFDYLVLALGSRYNYFGNEDWKKYAPSLQSIPEATALRARVLNAFERAERENDRDERKALMTFCVVGGGPTGVEIAGALAELARRALKKEFRVIDPTDAQVFLFEAGPRILSGFCPTLSSKAQKALERLGVQVWTDSPVQTITAGELESHQGRIRSHTIIWAAGVQAAQAGEWLSAETDKSGRVRVLPDLSVPTQPDIFVIGDAAHVPDKNGEPLYGLAPVAMQEGKHVAKLLRERIKGARASSPFRYRDKGQMAT
ncbi:MAG: NAD(P)/FAD-dependent oxidoreductase, partial [bacterium]|nr:NAD(P)/FAD-dependent oxidoreductase [bacterium]